MPFQTIPNTNVRYALIAFDKDGKERTDDSDALQGLFSNKILADAKANPPSHVFLFSHGWKGDMRGSEDQYNRWIKAMTDLPHDVQRMGPNFKPLWIGLHWPSQPLGDESFGGESFDVDDAVVDNSNGAAAPDAEEVKQQAVQDFGGSPEVQAALDLIFKEQRDNASALSMPDHVAEAYQTLARAIGYTSGETGDAPDQEGVPFDPHATFDAFGESDFGARSFFGKLLSPLAQLSYWQMKYRARTIGEGGMHNLVKSLQQALPAAKFHLMGHSFGCIVVSSILGGPKSSSPLPRPVDSLVLVQGAVSLWAYADHVKDDASRKSGYFNPSYRPKRAVKGPIVVTRSKFDSAVGKLFALATAVVPIDMDGSFDTDLKPTRLPLIGGIGTFGVRGLEPSEDLAMKPANQDYALKPGHIYNLMADDYVKGHSNIDGPEVAHAIWQAAAQS